MNKSSMYDVETYIAEVYDQLENHLDDVILVKELIEDKKLKVLEPFCGTGRISIPLAEEGHQVVGIDNAQGMLDWFKGKLIEKEIPDERIELIQGNVLTYDWPKNFDLVILGCNCFYELATPQEQETCIEKAYKSLKVGGYVYIDNDHMEGELDHSWQENAVERKSLWGITKDGAVVETTRKTIWYDVPQRLAKFERKAKITKPTGEIIESMYIQQKHPVSTYEVQHWLEKHGFEILKIYGDRNGEAYSDESPRAIFWARKKS